MGLRMALKKVWTTVLLYTVMMAWFAWHVAHHHGPADRLMDTAGAIWLVLMCWNASITFRQATSEGAR